MVDILHNLQLLLYDLVEGAPLYGEQAVLDDLSVLLPDDGLEAHPEGDA